MSSIRVCSHWCWSVVVCLRRDSPPEIENVIPNVVPLLQTSTIEVSQTDVDSCWTFQLQYQLTEIVSGRTWIGDMQPSL